MWEFLRQNQFIVGALSGSLAAYILGLGISHLKREKMWLGYTVGSRNIVQGGPSRLSLTYDKTVIRRLDSHAVVLRNIGNRPLVKLPVRIECPGAQIVEHEVKGPDNTGYPTKYESPQMLVLDLDLLNPGEAVEIGLTVIDSPELKVRINARAANLVVKEVSPNLPTGQLIDILLDASSGSFAKAIIASMRLFR